MPVLASDGLAAWITFPVTLLAGAVMWEGVPHELAAIHAADWLFQLLAITAIVTVWVTRPSVGEPR